MQPADGESDARQLAVLKEFSNIANVVSDEEFLSIMPRSKLKRVKWLPILQCLRDQILEGVVQDWSGMWEEEGMSEKLDILDKQREKFADRTAVMWRPQLANVKAQVKAYDIAILQKQKHLLELQAVEHESKVNKLKKTVAAKRGYLRAIQQDIQKCHKKINDCNLKLNECFENRKQMSDVMFPVMNDMEISETPPLNKDDLDLEFN